MVNGEEEPLSREEIQEHFLRLEAQERDTDAREKDLGDRFEKEGLDNPFAARPTRLPSTCLGAMSIADARRWYSSRFHQLTRQYDLFSMQQDVFMIHLRHQNALTVKVADFLRPILESGEYELWSTNPKVEEERIRLVEDAATGYWKTFPDHERTDSLNERLIACLEFVVQRSIGREHKTLFYDGFPQSS